MKVSIALATFNGSGHLQAQLDSLAAQTRLPDELVVCDDGSTDDTCAIVQAFARAVSFRVLLLRNDSRKGYSGNFARALDRTTGDVVFLCDQDDVWLEGKIETLTKVLASDSGVFAAMNDAALTDETLAPAGLTKLEQIRNGGFSDGAFIMGCCAALSRDFLDWALPIPEQCPSHDEWLLGLAIDMGGRVIIDQPLQYYRRHGENESQGIYNSLTHTTRSRVAIEKLKRRLAVKRSKAAMQPRWIETRDANYAIEERCDRIPAHLRERLEAVLGHRRKRTHLIEERIALRARALPARFRDVWRLWRNRSYDEFSGFHSLVSDLLGD